MPYYAILSGRRPRIPLLTALFAFCVLEALIIATGFATPVVPALVLELALALALAKALFIGCRIAPHSAASEIVNLISLLIQHVLSLGLKTAARHLELPSHAARQDEKVCLVKV